MTGHTYSPPIQVGLHMVEDDGAFTIAASLKNPTSEALPLRTMDGGLFHISLKERTFTEDGLRHLWSEGGLTTQAVTHWRLEPDSRVTRHYDVPNAEQACQQADEFIEEFDFYDENDMEQLMTGPDFASVEPDEVGVVRIEASIPSVGNYHETVTRQLDLRSNRHRVLDDSLLPADMSAIERNL